MGNHIFTLFFGSPKRMLWTLVGMVAVFASAFPRQFDWVMVRAFNALWPWIQIGGYIAVTIGIFVMIFRPKKGG